MDIVLTVPYNSLPTMESKARAGVTSDAPPHQRTKSSILKSILPGNHRPKPSSKSIDPSCWKDSSIGKEGYIYLGNQSILPPDHPHTRQHLREDSGNRNTTTASPKKSVNAGKERKATLGENQNMTRSASFKSLVGKRKEEPSQKERKKKEENNMQKSKSSTSISAILLRPRSSKGVKAEETRRQKDKENQTPPSSAGMAPPPIWAQFATQGFEEPSHTTTRIPLNDQFAVEEEVALYTPRDYSPSKQRNFQDYQQPTLCRRAEPKPRPKSECIASGPISTSFAETISGLRKSGRDQSQVDIPNLQQQTGQVAHTSRKLLGEECYLNERPSSVESRKVSNDTAGSDLPMPKRGSRVMAAVAVFNGKAKELPKDPPKDTETVQLDPMTIENAFESLLVSKVLRRLGRG